MGILVSVLGGIVGAVLGAVAGFLVGGLAAEIFDVSDFEGASGYFVVFLFGLPGALIGLITGILVALRWHRRRTAPPQDAPATAVSTLGRFAAAFAIIVALVAGATWIYIDVADTTIAGPNQASPRLSFEVRLPPGTVLPERQNGMSVRLFTGDHEAFGGLDDDWRHEDGGRPMISGWFDLYTKTPHRLLSVAAAPSPSPATPAWVFKLRLARKPGHMAEYSPWYPVDYLDDGGQADMRKAGPADRAEIRYRLVFAGRD